MACIERAIFFFDEIFMAMFMSDQGQWLCMVVKMALGFRLALIPC